MHRIRIAESVKIMKVLSYEDHLLKTKAKNSPLEIIYTN